MVLRIEGLGEGYLPRCRGKYEPNPAKVVQGSVQLHFHVARKVRLGIRVALNVLEILLKWTIGQPGRGPVASRSSAKFEVF